MTERATTTTTQILLDLSRGDPSARERLMPLVYDELRRLAAGYLKGERPGHTLQPTALAHEAWLRLVDQSRVDWRNRSHFFGIAASMMRRVLVDHARARVTAKRGDGRPHAPIEAAGDVADRKLREVIEMHEALEDLRGLHERQARVVELRYFGGLSIEEAAEVVGVSARTVKSDWTFARAWLRRQLER